LNIEPTGRISRFSVRFHRRFAAVIGAVDMNPVWLVGPKRDVSLRYLLERQRRSTRGDKKWIGHDLGTR